MTAGRLDALVAETFPLFNQPVLLPDLDLAKHGARHDVDLHRLRARITEPETRETVEISGLLAVPANARGPLPVVSWQHGTVLSYDQVPSSLLRLADPHHRLVDGRDSMETLLNVHRFAGRGYAVIAADYVGKGPWRQGRSEGYTVKGVTVRACTAMLDTGLSALRSLGHSPGKLFLNGWSQGALNTQWLHQALRQQGRSVAATSVASPFNDLSETFRFWAEAQTFARADGVEAYPALPDWIALCMIVALGSYQDHYGLNGLLRAAVRPEFHELALGFWSSYSMELVSRVGVPAGRDLLVAGFFDRFTDRRNSAFLRQLAANSSTYWHYDAPIRFHFGLADEALHPRMVGRALAAGGSNATGVPVAGASHRGNFLASLYGDAAVLGGRENVFEWFDASKGRPG